MLSKPSSPFEELETNKSVFQSEPEVLPCFEMNYKFLERHKKTSFVRDNENGKQKFNQTRRGSDNGRSARVDCHIHILGDDALNASIVAEQIERNVLPRWLRSH